MPAEESQQPNSDTSLSNEEVFAGAVETATEIVDRRPRSRTVRVAQALRAAHRAKEEALISQHAVEIEKAAAEHRAREAELALAATIDPLTGAKNRTGLDQEHLKLVARQKRKGQRLGAAVAVDLDFFKEHNDAKGHEEGDKILVSTVENMRNYFRPYDTIVRLGGDELMVLMEGATPEQAAERSEELRRSNEAMGATLSIGVAPIDADLTTTMRNADEVLYHTKNNGRNKVFYQGADQQPVLYVPPTTEQA